MKVNVFLTFIAIALASLVGYWAYDVAEGQENDIMCGISSFVCFLATLIPTIGLKYESARIGINIRVLSAIFFIIFFISHFSFAAFGVKMPYYIIVNGIMLTVFIAIIYKMANIKTI